MEPMFITQPLASDGPVVTPNVVSNQPQYSIDVIPKQLYQYLTKKNNGADQLLSDIALDQRLSTDDIAMVFYLNSRCFTDLFSQQGIYLGWNNIANDLCRFKPHHYAGLNAKIKTALEWSTSEKIKQQVHHNLNGVYDEANPPYQFIVTGPKIWLTVTSGFLTLLKNPIARLQFYRDYLLAVGSIASFKAVASTDVFTHYVEEVVG